MVKEIPFERFLRLAEKFGLKINEIAQERFKTYHSLLLEWGEKINLYSKNDKTRLLAYHFLDSLLPINLIPQSAVLADIGSGAGFPGLPIKIMRPDLKVFLFEAKKKKAIFLSYAAKSIGLSDITVIDKRIEEFEEARFDLFTIRLLGSLKEIIPLISHLLKENSRMIFYKTGNLEKELKEGERVMKRFGISCEGIHTFRLPWLKLTRRILILAGIRK